MISSTKKIKNKALELGFDLVGIAGVDLIENEKNYLNNWLEKGHHASMSWMEKRKEEKRKYFKILSGSKISYFIGC